MMQIWMRLAGAACMVAGSSGLGFWLSGQYRERLRELEQLRQMIFLLKGQILYANATLEEGLEAVGRRTRGALAGLFLQAADRIAQQEGEPFCQIWKEAVGQLEQAGAGHALSRSDLAALAALGEHLGFLDRDMQERTLLLYLEQLDLQIQALREHRQERCRLYSSLGIMGGLFLTILLI
ncbi:MAG TPA: stage III sporulation protein AB [Candidatus Ventrimonas merdavium]|nr:stage III sporulation protein AB [Candidatus Ventrimonas merdavium]